MYNLTNKKSNLAIFDPQLYKYLQLEKQRQNFGLELIASENIVSQNILASTASLLTNKYAEGYSGKRYYGGCQNADLIENLAIYRAKKLFNAAYVNVQPHSGSQANAAVYQALLNPGDIILGMSLAAGGHLTHGSKVNFSGQNYHAIHYGVDNTGWIDFNEVEYLAQKYQPKMIIAGFSSYSRKIDWQKFRQIADAVGAYLLVDMAHVAGLVAAEVYPSPVNIADITTCTTHKTLRGPRGGMILAKYNPELQKKLQSGIFPRTQGGPLMHVIAAKAVAFKEALTDDFKIYQQQVVQNAKQMVKIFLYRDFHIISGGTDNHMFVVDLQQHNISGKQAETLLDTLHITVNKNMIPKDQKSPVETSGIRIGTPAITSRGLGITEVEKVAHWICDLLQDYENINLQQQIKKNVMNLCQQFPIYNNYHE